MDADDMCLIASQNLTYEMRAEIQDMLEPISFGQATADRIMGVSPDVKVKSLLTFTKADYKDICFKMEQLMCDVMHQRDLWKEVLHPEITLGEELTQALLRAIERQIDNDRTLTPDPTVHFTPQSRAFALAFQSTTFTVREFEEGSERLDTYLQSLAAKLNSNEEFTPDDTFTMETTFIPTPGRGSGNGKRYKLNKAAARGITKKSRVTIKNKDQLCCARAIVTMKALANAHGNTRDQDYYNLKQGYPVQER